MDLQGKHSSHRTAALSLVCFAIVGCGGGGSSPQSIASSDDQQCQTGYIYDPSIPNSSLLGDATSLDLDVLIGLNYGTTCRPVDANDDPSPGENTNQTVNSDTTENDVNTQGSGLSCYGTRVWGPLALQEGFELYFSEPGGLTTVRNCVAGWLYHPARNCSETFALPGDSVVNASAGGNLIYTDEGSAYDVEPAGISLELLVGVPDC